MFSGLLMALQCVNPNPEESVAIFHLPPVNSEGCYRRQKHYSCFVPHFPLAIRACFPVCSRKEFKEEAAVVFRYLFQCLGLFLGCSTCNLIAF